MQLNGEMGATMTERFNVTGALLVKLFGRPAREAAEFAERAGDVRDIGRAARAMSGRIYYGALALVGSLGTAAVYWLGGRAVINGAITVGTLIALRRLRRAALLARSPTWPARAVDLLTALVSFERVLRGARRAARRSSTRPTPPRWPRPAGRVEVDDVWFRYPAPPTCRIAVARGRRRRPLSDRAVGLDPAGRVVRAPSPGRWSRWSGRPARARPR